MAQIPSDIVREVFLRLPAESLLRLRAVCKEWCNIIDDKSFIHSHSINSQLCSTTLLIKKYPSSTRLYSISVDSLINCIDRHQEILEATSVPAYSRHRFTRSRLYRNTFFPLPSCNGLILLHPREQDQNWVILNPFTRKFRQLPLLQRPVGFANVGFGYDSSSDDFKVVSIFIDGDLRHAYGFIYSLKTDYWRRIEAVDPKDISPYDRDGVFLNGFLYWPSNINYYLIRFNLATELYDKVPLPEIDREPTIWDCVLLDGCLGLSVEYIEECFMVWVMKEGRWLKLFSIETNIRLMRPISYLKRRKGLVLLMSWCDRKLYLLDIEKNSMRMVNIQVLPDQISLIMCFSQSLFQLEQSYDVTTKRIKRSRAGTNSRLKLNVTTKDI